MSQATNQQQTASQDLQPVDLNNDISEQVIIESATLPIESTAVPSPKNVVTHKQASRKMKLGVIVSDYTNGSGQLSSLNNKLDQQISSVTIYKQFGMETNKYLDFSNLKYIADNNFTLVITWEPWDPRQQMSQEQDYLALISSGALDPYLIEFATSIKNFQKPVVLRFAHEMNGNWYPWGNRATEYVKAYQHIHQLFKRENVNNVSWEWSVNADTVPYQPTSSIAQYYPGNEFVDLIGIDGYNFGGERWQEFDAIFSPMYTYLSKTYSQPIVISEVASSEHGGNKPHWVKTMFENLQSSKYQRVSEVRWFSILKEADWRIDSSDSVVNAFQQSIR